MTAGRRTTESGVWKSIKGRDYSPEIDVITSIFHLLSGVLDYLRML
jgi:hypothetical protein